ncbi:hypothetical protein HJG60_010958 [Phyllostomus discolor]|uniref:Uncharacterized protein n=1 Tax=Phyllostomus discolor TaxID=89673 RepID=A0A834ACE8_9CHIR|nr:hypothetical protein HJG60_010958 [Phyllostomus discolor]
MGQCPEPGLPSWASALGFSHETARSLGSAFSLEQRGARLKDLTQAVTVTVEAIKLFPKPGRFLLFLPFLEETGTRGPSSSAEPLIPAHCLCQLQDPGSQPPRGLPDLLSSCTALHPLCLERRTGVSGPLESPLMPPTGARGQG